MHRFGFSLALEGGNVFVFYALSGTVGVTYGHFRVGWTRTREVSRFFHSGTIYEVTTHHSNCFC